MLLHNLQHGVLYTVLVRAATETTLGNPTVPITFKTKSGVSYNLGVENELADTYDLSDEDDAYYKQKLGTYTFSLFIVYSYICSDTVQETYIHFKIRI